MKLNKPIQSYCCPVQKKIQVNRNLWRGSFNFKINISFTCLSNLLQKIIIVIKFLFVSVYLELIIYIFDDIIIGVIVVNEVFLGRRWFRLLFLWWRWAKGQKIPEQLKIMSTIMCRNLYWLSPFQQIFFKVCYKAIVFSILC